MFKFRVIHEHVSDPDTRRRLGGIEEALNTIIKRLNQMALNFSRLEAEVTEISSAVDSAVTLIQRIAQEIRDSITNQAKLEELANSLDAKATALAEAVAANTPAEPTA